MSESSKKAKENLRIALANKEKCGELNIMRLEETYYSKDNDWGKARRWALQMMDSIRGLREEFVLDCITKGDGNCFPTAILQQIRRPHVIENQKSHDPTILLMMTQAGLRRSVFEFLTRCTHPLIESWKENFKNITDMEWTDYWSFKYMLKSGIWADEIFIRGTAFFLNMDIVIHQNKHPRIEKISGNMDNEHIACENPVLHVGYLANLHYQSIIPRAQINNKPLDIKQKVEAQKKVEVKFASQTTEIEDLEREIIKARKMGTVADQNKEEDSKKLEGIYTYIYLFSLLHYFTLLIYFATLL